MSYLISKSNPREEYRVYLDGENIEGTQISKGHKLGLETGLLLEILEYRIEKSTNKIHFLNYDKVEESIDTLNSKLWTIGKKESLQKNLLDSWISLNRKMRMQFGDFRKVVVTKVYI